jgi:hypothetical protein
MPAGEPAVAGSGVRLPAEAAKHRNGRVESEPPRDIAFARNGSLLRVAYREWPG